MLNENLRKMDDHSLLNKTKSLVAEERKLTAEILRFLAEVQRRRLYALRGFSSMHEFATQFLGYTAAAAHRRLAAVKVLKEVPEIEGKIESGSISLSNVALAQKFFKLEESCSAPLSTTKKKEILQKLEGKSTRDSERELASLSSQPEKLSHPDRVKPISATHVEIRFTADQSTLDLIEKVKGLLAHKFPHPSMAQVISEMAKLSLQKLEPKKPKSRIQLVPESMISPAQSASNSVSLTSSNPASSSQTPPNAVSANQTRLNRVSSNAMQSQLGSPTSTDKHLSKETPETLSPTVTLKFGAEVRHLVHSAKSLSQPSHPSSSQSSLQSLPQPSPQSLPQTLPRYSPEALKEELGICSSTIPAAVKRTVYHRDEGECTYRDPLTGRRCGSSFALEYNHRIPAAQGGPSTVENIHLVCRTHNLALAIRDFGIKKMSAFLQKNG